MERYNVLYIHTHDSGRYFSNYGYSLDTPNIESFSKISQVFNQAFSVSPTCSPSRTALMSSKYPHQNGMLGLVNRGFMMDDYDDHFVRWLNNENYNTALCGIQHEAGHYKESEKARQIIGYKENLTTDLDLDKLEDKRRWDKENTENAISWLKKYDEEQPFFLSLGFFGTHRPYPANINETRNVIPDGFPNTPQIREDFTKYNNSVKFIDECFGNVIETMEELGLLENTIILFTTDHGLAYPFGKSSLTDLGLSVALMLYLPWYKTGNLYDSLVSQINLVPTLCDFLNLKIPKKVEGKSLLPIIEKKQDEVNEELFFEMNFHTSFEPARAIRTHRYKYIEYLDDYEFYQLSNINDSEVKEFYINLDLDKRRKPLNQLYDLYYDPDEKNNLIDDLNYRNILNELSNKLNKWKEETGDIKFNEDFHLKPEWVVNKKESRTPSGESIDDFIEGHEHRRYKKN